MQVKLKIDAFSKNRLLAFFRNDGVLLGAVTAARLLAAFNAGGVQGAADDLITNAREVANTAAANEDDGVFLQFVAFAGDVNGNFFVVRETNTGDAAERGIRFFRRHGSDQEANAAFLRATFEDRRLGVAVLLLAIFTH